jgi:two-component system CheB/CheR fusion protein
LRTTPAHVSSLLQARPATRVFATDINEAAIEKARRGAYIENIAADVSPERLARYFIRAGKEYHISRKLRDLCIFSRHDLLNDPPFSRMDLISCRNVLIYLDSMHEQAFSKFHFALNPGGFLLLGKSEAAPPGLFAPLDKAAKVYVRQESAGNPAATHRKGARQPPREAVPAEQPRPPRRVAPRVQADRIVVQRYGPPRVVVNASLDAVANSSDSGVLESIKSEADAVRSAIQTARKTGQCARVEHVKVRGRERPRLVSPHLRAC